MANDPDCIFCKIVSGQIPCCRVLEDEHSLAFMDVGPVADGHVLLIPKQHFATLDGMPAGQAAAVLGSLPSLVRAVKAATGCQGVNVLQNNGQAAHQLVPHVHFHIIPRNPGDEFHFNWPASAYGRGRMEALAGRIRAEL